ncbi:MAG TPA: glycosyltransferase family 4 protein [Gaiellaceae bacterium]|jgi:glycosyltransferase involved in cell wall biosynthesis
MPPRTVLHLGPDVREPGGMANVIRAYLRADLAPWRVEAVATYAASSRPRWLARLVASAARVATAPRSRTAGLHLHASERFDLTRTLALLELAQRRGLPRIVTLHGAEFMHEVRTRPRLVRRMLSRADVVTVLSAEVEKAVRALGVEHVRLLPNAVDVPAAAAPLSGSDVLFAGEVGRRKGVDVLLEAWPSVRGDRPEATLRLVGPIAEPELLAALPEGCRYDGVLTSDEVTDALGSSCLAVLPSRAEAMPMFILEAMAAGVPVVATPVGSVEWLLSTGGRVVPAGDAAALAAALAELLGDRAQLRALGAAARRRVEDELSSAVFERNVKALYAEVFG